MIRVVVTSLILATIFVACGPKTTSKISLSPEEAKAKFGNGCNAQEIEKLAQADALKTSADGILAIAEEDFSVAKELMDKASKEEAKEKIQWFEQRADKAYNKGYEKKIEASQKYATANQQTYSSYNSAIGRYRNTAPKHVKDAAETSLDEVKTLFTRAAGLRKEATVEKDLKKKSNLLQQANELEFLALDEQRIAFNIYTGVEKIEAPQVEDNQIDEPKKLDPPVVDELNETENENHSLDQIVYKVQIAASRIELATEVLVAIYNPKPGERINNTVEDGWYKYAIGEFATYAEAEAYKEEVGVGGAFIIANRKNKQILLPEIEAKIKRGEMSDPRKAGAPISQSDVIYMVQIAATKIPARPSQVKQMYHGKQIVSIRQSRGWYKYTVGNFDSREKAELFREDAAVDGSFVVAFDKSGKEIKLER